MSTEAVSGLSCQILAPRSYSIGQLSEQITYADLPFTFIQQQWSHGAMITEVGLGQNELSHSDNSPRVSCCTVIIIAVYSVIMLACMFTLQMHSNDPTETDANAPPFKMYASAEEINFDVDLLLDHSSSMLDALIPLIDTLQLDDAARKDLWVADIARSV